MFRTDSKQRRLAELAVLHGLPHRLLRRVAAVADEVALPAGTVLLRQGARSDAAYLLASGFLDVLRDDAEVAMLRPGDVVGETGVLGRLPRNATVVAATDAVLYEIPARFFSPLVDDSPELAERMRPAA